MAIIKSFAPFLNLSNYQTFLVDENPNSDYFRITEFKETFTGGKNGFLIEGSPFLRETTEVKIEILDVEGNPIYFEPGDGVPEYYEGTSKLVAVHVYDDTPIGVGKITILGELKNYVAGDGSTLPIPPEWKDVYNVKWEKTFKINKNLNNEDVVRFYKRPIVGITELVKPIFSKSVPTVTESGSVSGISQLPLAGTDLTNYRAGTSYKLVRSSGSWDRDVDENNIRITVIKDSNGNIYNIESGSLYRGDGDTIATQSVYSPRIIEVLNDREVLVDTPYTSGSVVYDFVSESYSITYADFQNEVTASSALTGSFAKIDITNLKTFVGDVARVKVFRKSRSDVGDFQFVQESKLESTELLRDIFNPNNTEIPYGRFDEYNLETYWVTESVSHPTTIDSSVLSQAVKVDYNGSGVQKLITSQSFSLSKDVEYTLNFRTLLSGSISDEKYLKAYFSGSFLNGNSVSSSFTQSFVDITANPVYLTRQNVSQNILAERDIDAKLVFEFKGDDWYVSNVSLKNAQDTSFSPDEFTLIQDIPRKLASETFDFRFEFYDINNNYIPVDVNASAIFDGGNDFPTSAKLLNFESDRNAFRFSSGSIANPPFQQIQFKITSQNLTGSATFASSAFDVSGGYLDPSNYSQYPGLLTNITPAGALLTLDNFTGSYTGGGDVPYVGSIIYTASLDGLEEFETVFRLEDGDNAPQLIVTSNANQFIYEPTTLSPKPSGQSITIRAQRKNLASLFTPITVNSGSNRPGLTYVDTVGGIDTYTISATQFSSSFSVNSFDEVTYQFTGSDIFGNQQVDEITISKVINFDGVSIVLSNESTAFPANSTGEVIGGFVASSGSVQMYIGGNQILHDDEIGGRSKNTFNITSSIGDGVTPTDTTPNTANYSISAFETSKDSGSLTLTIDYLAGDNSTTQSFQKVVSYTKAKKGVPTILTKASPASQTINSSSALFEDPQPVEVFVMEGGDEYSYSSTSLTGGLGETNKFEIISIVSGSNISTEGAQSGSISPTKSPNGTNGSAIVSYVDSEGTLVSNKTIRFDVGVSKVGVDGLNGASGSNAKVVRLNSTAYAIKYDGDGNLAPTGQTFTLSGSAQNFSSPEFQFFQNGNDISNGFSGVSQIIIPTTTGSLPTPGASNLYEVRVRENGDSWNGVFDNIDVFGVQSGSDAFTVFLTNEAHTFTATSQSVVSPSNIAAGFTEVRFFRGTEQYTYNQSGGVGSNTYKTGSISLTNITVSGSILSSQLKITPLTLTADQGSYVVPIIDNNTGTTLNKTYTFSKSKAGVTGADGVNGSAGSGSFTVSLTSNKYSVTYDQFGTLAPAGQTITLTATASLAFDSPQFEFLSGSDVVQPYSTTNTYSVSPLPTPGQTVLYQVNTREGGGGPVLAFDNIDVFGIQSGSDAFTVFLTNEAHTFAANSDGVITSTLADGATEVRFFRGTQQYTYATSGTNTYSVSATSSSIELAQSTVSSQRKFTPTSVSGDAGTATITITDNNTSKQFVKTYTFTRSKKGAPVATILANPQAQSVTSGSISGIGTPSNVTIIVNEGGSNYTYDNSAPYGNSTFRITGVTNATNNNNGTITPNTPTSSTPVSGVVTIAYVNSEGTAFSGKTVDFTVGVAGIGSSGATGATGDPGDPGADGPGIVFRGPWSSTTTYYDTDDFPTRRDAVLYNGTYYATLPNATTNLNKQPDTQTTFWESLGTDDFFVAAKIAIFEESFVQNTINVGTNTSGNANITIAGGTTSPYISIGQATKGYDQVGAFLGSNGTTGRLSLKSATNSLLWDGTNLSVNGSGTFTGTVSGGSIVGGTISIGSGNSIFKADSNGIYLGNSTFASAPFRVTPGGSLTATLGTIGGWTIDSNSLFSGTKDTSGFTAGGITLSSAGAIHTPNFYTTAAGAGFSGSLVGAGGTFTNLTVVDGGMFIGFNNDTFYGLDFRDLPIGGGTDFYGIAWSDTGENTIATIYYDDSSAVGLNLFSDSRIGILGSPVILNAGATSISMNQTSQKITVLCDSFDVDKYVTPSSGGNITATGNITAYYSDDRLKIRLGEISNPLEKIKTLSGFYYKGNDLAKTFGYDSENLQIGVSAQEVQRVLPEIVKDAPFNFRKKTGEDGNSTDEFLYDIEENDRYKTVQYEKLVPLLIEGIKELTNKVESLEKEIFKLKGEK
jgi:hypothetical protein